jgi:hypothetical protein
MLEKFLFYSQKFGLKKLPHPVQKEEQRMDVR